MSKMRKIWESRDVRFEEGSLHRTLPVERKVGNNAENEDGNDFMPAVEMGDHIIDPIAPDLAKLYFPNATTNSDGHNKHHCNNTSFEAPPTNDLQQGAPDLQPPSLSPLPQRSTRTYKPMYRLLEMNKTTK